ncbi:type ISP restriction/modification enzyme [Beggiatoa leptomitoformis]|uniref:site-specific DNA-methyltransferase (adenine-specific) n=1 Tax=Beggiatoa leptomitoformis TaxID=288004 RepID=A0A2N9YCT4_9GAMM|nr:type ISP restriction/modification enzyme [Beggiatoa leptomitoformis]ALG66435.1 N-6 DNA methylase [Beggiatoa leptomitoformis]AUI68288.1 N-6 DNA methylase [Beggiatoa leptomitoformis]
MSLSLKPDSKVVKEFYSKIKSLHENLQNNEGAVAPYFANLLRHCLGQFPLLDLVEQFSIKRDGRKPLRADGAIVDKQTNVLLYGIWEAKDSKDKLKKEVEKKFKDGYPKDNILFQSPDYVILYQHGVLAFEESLDNPENLITVLELFLGYKPPVYAQWEEAIEAFKDKVGELGKSLVKIINSELKTNKAFILAFDDFSNICRESINPSLSPDAVVEMLVQHLLTERLFRTIFDNSDFTNKNIIAHEIEKVIQALTVKSFSRKEFLKSLDRFYVAIEETASTIHSYSRKQDFLNAVYENFFQGFAVKVADTHGIVYTPQPIVDFMVNSVQEILKREFDKTLSSPDVHILDPFTGTGNFLLRVMQEINPLSLEDKYKKSLHCNEIMLLPYYVASMNIEHAYYEKTGKYEPFQGICLVDTFEMLEGKQYGLGFSVPENTERVRRQKESPIFVILGNPPYNIGQQDENDNNKNRRYPHLDTIIAETYAKDSKATLKKSLSDAYIKAFAWATERLAGRENGVIAFVTNNGFLETVSTDGMRKHLAKDFNKIYILDLGGNVRKNPKLSGTTHNVFGIQVGVSIAFLVKNDALTTETEIYHARLEELWRKVQKFEYLENTDNYVKVDWQKVIPDTKNNWITNCLTVNFDTFIPIASKEGKATESHAKGVVFKIYSLGVATNRDTWAYNFNSVELAKNMQLSIDTYNEQVSKYSCLTSKPKGKELEGFIDNFVNYDDKKISWSSTLKLHLSRSSFTEFENNKIRPAIYRPFTKVFLYFDNLLIDRRGQFSSIFPTPETEKENQVVCLSGVGSNKPFHSLIVKIILCLDSLEKTQCFPFYVYAEDGTKTENITDWALTHYQEHYQDESLNKWDIFHYIYGVLHHEGYRETYQANLKRELPRIPLLSDFWAISRIGKQLAELHLNYETQAEYELEIDCPDRLDYRVEKMKFNKDKTAIIYNESLTLKGIPAEALEYRLGNRSALDWIIDQYQVSTDKRSGITNDPNNLDDEQYIIRLVRKIVTVSIETVKLVKELSKQPL